MNEAKTETEKVAGEALKCRFWLADNRPLTTWSISDLSSD